MLRRLFCSQMQDHMFSKMSHLGGWYLPPFFLCLHMGKKCTPQCPAEFRGKEQTTVEIIHAHINTKVCGHACDRTHNS